MSLQKEIENNGFEFKERVPITKKVGKVHSIRNNVSTTLRNYETLLEKGEIIDFALIPFGNNEYEIYVKYPSRKD